MRVCTIIWRGILSQSNRENLLDARRRYGQIYALQFPLGKVSDVKINAHIEGEASC